MRFAQEISIFNPFAIEKAVIGLDTSITQTARKIELQATEIAVINGKVETNTASLSVMAGEIASKVESSTYETFVRQTNQAITAEVKARGDADGALSSRIDQSAHTISMSVSGKAGKTGSGAGITITLKDKNGNTLSSGSGNILIDGNVIFSTQLTDGTTTISGSNIKTGTISLDRISGSNGTLTISTAGALRISAGNFRLDSQGNMTTYSGTIGPSTTAANRWIIGGNSSRAWIYSGSKTSLSSTNNGVYIGTDGIEVRLNQGSAIQNNWTKISTDGFWTTWLHIYSGDGSASAVISDLSRGLVGGAPRIGFANGIVTGAEGVNSSYTYFYNGVISKYDITIDSDVRFKTDIERIDKKDAVDFIKNLLPSKYRLKDDKKGLIRHGFIAQEVKPFAWDSLVRADEDEEGLMSIGYTEIIADIVATLQVLLTEREG